MQTLVLKLKYYELLLETCLKISFFTYSFAEQITEGLDRAVMTMRKGEIAVVTICSDYGFRNAECHSALGTVPENETLLYEVELISFTKVCYSLKYLSITLISCGATENYTWKFECVNSAITAVRLSI